MRSMSVLSKPLSLYRLKGLRRVLVEARRLYYGRLWGMDLDPSCQFSLSTRFDLNFPRGIHIGAESYVAFQAAIMTHDMTRGVYLHTRIGRRCFIGARSMILPGITVGDGSIVGAGSVVTRDVPPGCIVAGNPARILRRDIVVGPYGRLEGADQQTLAQLAEGLAL